MRSNGGTSRSTGKLPPDVSVKVPSLFNLDRFKYPITSEPLGVCGIITLSLTASCVGAPFQLGLIIPSDAMCFLRRLAIVLVLAVHTLKNTRRHVAAGSRSFD